MTREKAVQFGPDRRLVGVWTAPKSSGATADVATTVRPAVIMLNSGLVPHSGIWRLHVRLARALAERGVPSLRFDLSGIGDSGMPSEVLPLDELVRQDVDAAITFVREVQQARQLVMLGLCSGARDALDAAGRHHDVVGLVAIDLMADLKIWQFHAVHFGARLLNPESWKNTLLGRNGRVEALLGMMTRSGAPAGDGESEPDIGAGVRTLLSRQELRERLTPLMVRDARVLLVYSGGLEDNYNHEGQFRAALPELARAPGLAVHFFPEANHTFEQSEQQRALIARIAAWCGEGFAAPGG